MRCIAPIFKPLKYSFVFFPFLILLFQQLTFSSKFSFSNTEVVETFPLESDFANEEKLEAMTDLFEYTVPKQNLHQMSKVHLQTNHSRNFQNYFLIKQFTIEVIVPPPKSV